MKKIALTCSGLLSLLLYSCQKESLVGPRAENGFRLSYSVLAAESVSPTTRSTVEATADENAINTLYILFFESSATGDGKFIEVYDASAADGSTLSPNGSIDVDFSGLSLNKVTPYNMLFVANVSGYLGQTTLQAWLNSFDGKSENQVVNEYNASTDAINHIHSGYILMSATGKKSAGRDDIKIELVRGVSRIDVQNHTDMLVYDLKSVSLWNAYPSTSVWSNNTPRSYSKERIKRYSSVDNVIGNKVVGQLYSFENNVSSPTQDDHQTTCLIIGLSKYGGPTSYYRVNVNLNQIGQSLVRNSAYRIDIQSVKGPGAPNEIEAYESGELLLNVSLNGWNEAHDGNVKYDGDNLFAVPTTKIVFSPDAETRIFSIFTSGAGLLSMTQQNLPTGLRAELDASKKQLSVTATASMDKRDGWIELSFAGMRTIIYISQTGEQDEYLELSQYTIPPFSAAGIGLSLNSITVTSSGSWTATIYDDVYSFSVSVGDQKKNGNNGENFNVFSVKDNPEDKMRYSFILISLDSNPDINRAIVLSQRGTGSIAILPNVSQLRFNANGNEINSGNEIITPTYLYPYAGEDQVLWTAALNGSYGSWFSLSSSSGTTSDSGTQNTPLLVTAHRNVTKDVLTANLRIRLSGAPTIFKDILVSQQPHTISLQHNVIPTIGVSGGDTPLITVTSSDPWEATLVVENTSARLSRSSGVSGDSFKVTFDENNSPGKIPKATLVVTVQGTAVSSGAITINQTAFEPRPLIIQTCDYVYGSMTMDAYPVYFDSWNSSIRNNNSFANNTSAKVYTAGKFTFITNYIPTSDASIWVMNQGMNPVYFTPIKPWLDSDPRNFMVVINDLDHGWLNTFMQQFSASFTCENDGWNTSSKTPRTVVARPIGVSEQKVWDYIMVNGPFGAVSDDVEFFGDGITGCLSSYPSTTVPILVNKTGGRVHLAIDPVLRILYIADCDMFSELYGRNKYPEGSEKWKFMNNVIAFMVNSGQYGDPFLNKFRP